MGRRAIFRDPYACWRCGRYVLPGNGHQIKVKVPESWKVDLETGEISWQYQTVRVGPDCIHYMREQGYEVVKDGPETVDEGHALGKRLVSWGVLR